MKIVFHEDTTTDTYEGVLEALVGWTVRVVIAGDVDHPIEGDIIRLDQGMLYVSWDPHLVSIDLDDIDYVEIL